MQSGKLKIQKTLKEKWSQADSLNAKGIFLSHPCPWLPDGHGCPGVSITSQRTAFFLSNTNTAEKIFGGKQRDVNIKASFIW